MTGPSDRLHDALHDLESSAPFDMAPRPRRTDRRPWIAAAALVAAAAVAAGMFIGLGALDRSVGQASPTPTPTPTLSSTPSTSASPSPSPSPTPASSTGMPTTNPVPAAEIEMVMRHGTDETLEFVIGFGRGTAGLVAAANVAEGSHVPATAPHTGNGAIYFEDGGAWRLVDTGETFRDVRFKELLSPPGMPMVLYGWPAELPSPREITGAWTSTDGMTWTEVDTAPTDGTFGAGPLGYLQARVERTTVGSTIELYISEDALHWELVHAVSAGTGASIRAAAAGEDGFVVAAQVDPDQPMLILASGDGRNWFEAPEQPSFTDDDVVITVAPIGPDWVAAGWRSVSGPSTGIDLWYSVDGLHWEPSGDIPPPEGVEPLGTRAMYPSHMISISGILFLSGAYAAEGSETRPLAVWTSADGRAWEQLDLGGFAEVGAVDRIDCCLWLGGRLGSDTGEAVIWRWDPSLR